VRGLRTLPLRMRRHHESGLAIADRLAGHPAVVRGCNPAFSNEPGRATLSGGPACSPSSVPETVSIRAFCNALRMFKLRRQLGRP
jgi:cystathionine beta-lyase/cystathionine gamma-synthase